jgi:peroxiredoxin
MNANERGPAPMLKGGSLLLMTAVLVVGILSAVPVRADYLVGDTVDDITLPGLDGEQHSLSDLRGRVVLLNFFTTWCPGCNEEAEQLQADFWEALEPDGLTVVSVNIQETPALVDGWAQALEVTYPIWLAPDWELFRAFAEFGALPYNTVIDTEGVLRYSQIGFDPGALSEVVAEVLSTAVPAERESWGAVKALFR